MEWIRENLGRYDDFFLFRVVGGVTAAILAVLSIVLEIDDSALLLAGLAAFFFAFPWSRLSALRAGPFEFSLERGQIKGAIEGIDVKGVEKDRIESVLSRLAAEIERARGSRVLWVDDKPDRLVAERRLFRSLEIETVMMPTCREAALTLKRDNDFDLVITSYEKGTERIARRDAGEPIADKRNFTIMFISWLRGQGDEGIRELVGDDVEVPLKSPVINKIPVVVYAAYSLSEIREKLKRLAGLEPGIEASRSLDDLLKKAIRSLSDLRSNPIEAPPVKKIFASRGTLPPR